MIEIEWKLFEDDKDIMKDTYNDKLASDKMAMTYF